MDQHLQRSFRKLEKRSTDLLNQLRTHSTEKLSFGPVAHWSVLQIIAHLITAERLSVMYMQKKMLGIDAAGNTGILDELKMGLLIISQRLPLKFKAPPAVVQQTTQATSLQQLEQEWNQVRKDLQALLEKIQPHQRKRKIYKHVVAGKLNAQQALRFFHEHFVHHQPQIKKLINL